jgi:biopolymer transport protein ExbD
MAGAIKANLNRTLQPNAEPNVIPFIDVLLVLLIIFMVTAPTPTTDIRVDVPNHRGPPAASDARPTIVSVLSNGGVLRVEVDGEVVPQRDLAERVLARAALNNPLLPASALKREARIYVRADMDVAYQSVVGVMDELYSARFAQIGVYGQRADA